MSGEQDPRPRPQYGEYADPGDAPNSAGSPAVHPDASVPEPAHGERSGPSATAPLVQPPSAPPAPASGALPGVPHNLGVGGAPEPARRQRTDIAPERGEPYRAASAPEAGPADLRSEDASPVAQHTPQRQAQPLPAGQPIAPRRTADRIITVLLLAIGAYGALSSALAMLQLPSYLTMTAGMLGVEDLSVPSQVATIGTIGAIVILSLYALVLIFSIRRLRARKLTFWAPLAVGAIAFLVYFLALMIGLAQVPELMQAAAQPDALASISDYLKAAGE